MTQDDASFAVAAPSLTQSQAIRGWLWTTGAVVVVVPVGFLVNAVLARQLGVLGYGRYAYLFTLLALLQGVLGLGYGMAVGRFAAAAHGRGDRQAIVALLRSHTSINTAWSGTSTSLLLLLLLKPSPTQGAVLVAASFLGAYMESSSLALPALQRTDGAAKASLVGSVLVQAAMLVAALVTTDPVLILTTRLVAGACLSPIRLFLLPPDMRRACLQFGPPRLPVPVLRYGLTAYGGALLGLLVLSRTEVLLLDFFEHKEAVGLFALAAGLAGQITAPVDAATGPLTPAMTSVLASNPLLSERLLLRSLRALATAVLVWSSIVVVLVPPAIPLIYGSDFAGSAGPFLILVFASVVLTAVGPTDAYAHALGRPDLPLKSGLVGLVAGMALALALIPPFALYGAAAASAGGQLAAAGYLLAATARAAGAGAHAFRPLMVVVVHLSALSCLSLAVQRAPQVLLSSIVATGVAAAATVWMVRRPRLVGWSPGEVESVLAAAPTRVAPFLRAVLPSATSRRTPASNEARRSTSGHDRG